MSFSKKISLGLGSGIALGLFVGEKVSFLHVLADAFVKLLQMTVLPYVMVSLYTSPYPVETMAFLVRDHRRHDFARLEDIEGSSMQPMKSWTRGLTQSASLPMCLESLSLAGQTDISKTREALSSPRSS